MTAVSAGKQRMPHTPPPSYPAGKWDTAIHASMLNGIPYVGLLTQALPDAARAMHHRLVHAVRVHPVHGAW